MTKESARRALVASAVEYKRIGNGGEFEERKIQESDEVRWVVAEPRMMEGRSIRRHVVGIAPEQEHWPYTAYSATRVATLPC